MWRTFVCYEHLKSLKNNSKWLTCLFQKYLEGTYQSTFNISIEKENTCMQDVYILFFFFFN